MITMLDVDLSDRRILIRADLNVPMKDGQITSDFRLRAAVPTIRLALEAGASQVIVVSHLGRPREGLAASEQQSQSMQPIVGQLASHIGQKVKLIEDWEDGLSPHQGRLVLLENIRFKQGEKANDSKLAKTLGDLCDVFVMDAFGAAHRAHASTCGIVRQTRVACAGPLLTREIAALSQVRDRPAQPLIALVGGAKVSDKLNALVNLSTMVDKFLVGGALANTLLAAAGYEIGKSLYEPQYLPQARKLLNSGQFILPKDVIISRTAEPYSEAINLEVNAVEPEDRILDIGAETRAVYADYIESAGTLIWNGPMGLFENPDFSSGTQAVTIASGRSSAFSVVGGGDTLAAIEAFGAQKDFSLISTGGGAFLEFMEGKRLPAIEALANTDINKCFLNSGRS